ncbi:unnamed protein product, partial [Brenthis ino]
MTILFTIVFSKLRNLRLSIQHRAVLAVYKHGDYNRDFNAENYFSERNQFAENENRKKYRNVKGKAPHGLGSTCIKNIRTKCHNRAGEGIRRVSFHARLKLLIFKLVRSVAAPRTSVDAPL